MTEFEYHNHFDKSGESLELVNELKSRIRVSRNIQLDKQVTLETDVVYIEITDSGGYWQSKYDFTLNIEQVDELITHLYNVRNGTNIGENNEPD